jgi:hypothetical protein
MSTLLTGDWRLKHSIPIRLLLLAVLVVLAVVLSGASATKAPTLQPDKLIILSTTDVKGKTSPCG